MDPLTALLDVLADLDDEVLESTYGLCRHDDAPLDNALFAWRDDGCPRPKSTLPPEPPPGFVRVEMVILVWPDGSTDVYPVPTGRQAGEWATYPDMETRALKRMSEYPSHRPAHFQRVVADVPLPVAPLLVVGTVTG